jgi:hypothetical protein
MTLPNEFADVGDTNGNVIGQLDLSTMRVLAPNRRVDEASEKGESIYMRKKGPGIATILTQDKPKRREQRR